MNLVKLKFYLNTDNVLMNISTKWLLTYSALGYYVLISDKVLSHDVLTMNIFILTLTLTPTLALT